MKFIGKCGQKKKTKKVLNEAGRAKLGLDFQRFPMEETVSDLQVRERNRRETV